MLPSGKKRPGAFSLLFGKNSFEVKIVQSLFNFVQVEHISLPALYRLVCREMGSGCKVKVLKMSAQVKVKSVWD